MQTKIRYTIRRNGAKIAGSQLVRPGQVSKAEAKALVAKIHFSRPGDVIEVECETI